MVLDYCSKTWHNCYILKTGIVSDSKSDSFSKIKLTPTRLRFWDNWPNNGKVKLLSPTSFAFSMSVAMHCARNSIHWLYQDIPREICMGPTEHGIIIRRRGRWARGILIQLKTTIRKCYKYVARERFINLIQLVIVSRLCKHVWTLIYFNIHTCIGLDTCHNQTHRNGTCKTVAEQWKLPMEKHHTHTMSPCVKHALPSYWIVIYHWTASFSALLIRISYVVMVYDRWLQWAEILFKRLYFIQNICKDPK